MPLIADWLIHCADPLGPRSKPPRRMLAPASLGEFVDQAEAHGVLATAMRHYPAFAPDAPLTAAGADGVRRLRADAAFALMLRREAETLMADASGLPATIVKGPVFATGIYPEASLRCFTDIDILAAPQAISALGDILDRRGYRLAERSPPHDPREWKWLHRDNERLMVELQTDLIHAASLNGALSLPYAIIADAPHSAASLLLVALVHGAAHQFERLQQIVDICQAARAIAWPAEQRRFEAMVDRANARFVAVTGLRLAASVLNEPRCAGIARALGPVRYGNLARMLIDRTVVMATMNNSRMRHAWRRQAYRELIKRQRRAAIKTTD